MIRIMPAQPHDLAALYELIDHSELPRAGLAEHLNSALIARKGDQLVGSVAVECYGDAGLLRSVAVDSAYRGQGVGAELIAAAFDLARRQGITTIYLLTTSAPDYFPRFGFHTIARTEVADAVRQSVEFTEACPASAIVMRAAVVTDRSE